MAIHGKSNDRLRTHATGKETTLPVLTDFPDRLTVSNAELDVLEAYLSDLVTELLKQLD